MTIEADVVIVGAGPCGLFQVFELGLLGIKAHLVDSLQHPGGQCRELYPDKPIYDIPAIPVCSAQQLVDNLMEQIKPFQAQFHLGEEARELQPQADGRFLLRTSKGAEFLTRCIVIAGGLGSFQPRKISLRGAQKFEGLNLHYKVTDKERYRGKKVLILGGGDSALDWVLELYNVGAQVALVHRRDGWRAAEASVQRMQELCASDPEGMRCFIANVYDFEEREGRLSGLRLRLLEDKQELLVEAEEFLAFYGLLPFLGPIGDWGLQLDKRQILVDTEKFQTSIPGIFAVGDVSTYPGKKKLILSGFHEAALAAFAIKHHLNPEEKVRLQYTTTSPIMHQRLGVTTPDA